MASYVCYPCGSLPRDSPVRSVAASPVEALAAAIGVDGAVHIVDDEGSLAVDRPIDSRTSKEPTVLCWHPREPTLIIGWHDGRVQSVSVSQDGKASVFEGGADHKSAIVDIVVSPEGGRVLSTDSAGVACVWRFDGRGRFSRLHTYRSAGGGSALTKSVWVPTRVPDGSGGTASLMAFFAGTDGGWLVYGDDQGNCNRVGGDFRAPIDVLEYDPASRRMVVITRDLAMAVLEVGPSAKPTLVTRAKLAVRASRGITATAWLGQGVLSTATGEEPAARAWLVGQGEGAGSSFLVKLSAKGRAIPRSDRVSAVAFLGSRSLLALGTVEGRVLVLRRVAAQEAGAGAGAGAADAPGSPSRVTAASSPARAGAIGSGPAGVAASAAGGKAAHPDWTLLRQVEVGGGVHSLSWSAAKGVLAVGHEAGAAVLQQVPMRRVMRWPLVAGQTGVRSVVVCSAEDPSARMSVDVPLNIKGIDCTHKTLIAFSARHIAVFEVANALEPSPGVSSPRAASLHNKFPFSCRDAVVYGDPRKSADNDTILAAAPAAVVSLNREGVIKHSLPVPATDGGPVCMARRGRFVAVATDAGALKLLDASRSEPRVLAEARFEVPGTADVVGLVQRMAVSADGKRVAIISSRAVGQRAGQAPGGFAPSPAAPGAPGVDPLVVREPDTRVHVWSTASASVASIECGRGRVPVDAAWDDTEARLLAVQTESSAAAGVDEAADSLDGAAAAAAAAAARGLGEAAPAGLGGGAPGSGEDGDAGADGSGGRAGETEVQTFFVTPEGRLLKHDSIPMQPPLDALLGLRVPDLVFMATEGDASTPAVAADGGVADAAGSSTAVVTRSLRDFAGLEDAPADTKAALLEFAFQLALGSMDAAFAAVKGVDSFSVWRSMAHMCVKSRRLDVAAVCLGNMGHVRGVRALRAAEAEPETESRVAMVAVQLGLLRDASRLYQDCGRFDLLNSMLQGCGEWTRALAVAGTADRIHERTTHHRYASHLESVGDISGAVEHYELAGTAKQDVPRMLAVKGRFAELREYVKRKADKDLTRWMGQFALSQNNGELAARLFNEAGAGLDLTRLLCMRREFDNASRLVMQTKDVPSAVHLARQLRSMGKHAEAIRHLEAVGRFDHATRVAIDAGMDTEAMTLALRADAPSQRAAAAYFREQGDLPRAVQLLRKGGDLAGALSLCFEGELFDDLEAVADELARRSASSAASGVAAAPVPTSTLRRCAEFFADHGQHAKAVSMLLHSRKPEEALEVAEAHRVPLTADMADALILPSKAPEGVDPASHKTRREGLLLRAARLLRKQEAFQLATKMYTQAGDTVKAMKCLIKSGDKEKIMVFAGVSRSKEIYVLAANFLQSLDWRTDAEVMKAIVSFYSKARAWGQLSGFFDACAQVEIDEFRNYDKAIGAMTQAAKVAAKIADEPSRNERVRSLESRIAVMRKYLAARAAEAEDPETMLALCGELLDQPDADQAIRTGDVFALLIEHYFKAGEAEKAYRLLEAMRERGIAVTQFLDTSDVDAIYRAAGVDPRSGGDDDVVDDEIDEDIADEVDE
ncbi:hypothetical protein FNF31_04973 [Cafeteria roenbergensis]|uniref:Uncharacterized protein n=1 Tax=Cafeteria roenbergensis TaxID=33653 RepID=A0A5A8CB96_CAFRO|nr:hypothetical protein FNF28_07389 [Cafeteria roenbergensis]KAA0159244.1 hypothetical protein FNF31_04973 [Cafeteria roenbergensis]